MKKLYLIALATVGLSMSANAAELVGINQLGGPTDAHFAGTKTCVIDVSTGTNAVLCTTGAGVIVGVIPSSTTSDVLVLRDSATANSSSAKLAAVGGSAATTIQIYPRFYNGLSANLSFMGGTWTIIYAQPK